MNDNLRTVLETLTLCVLVGVLAFVALQAEAAPMMVEDKDSVSLYHEVAAVGQTVNQDRVLTYWTVTFSGFDASGHYHGWREEVTTEGFATDYIVVQIANRQLLEKLRSNHRLAHGFMQAVKHGQTEEL